MKYQFFLPYDPPKKWTLLDVLLWVSCEKIPLSKFDSEGIEYRESPEIIFEHADWYGETCSGELSANDRKRLKVDVPSPTEFETAEIEEFQSLYPNLDVFHTLVQKSVNNTLRQARIREHYKSLRQKTKRNRAIWQNLNREKLDFWKMKLLIDLFEGAIVAEGLVVSARKELLNERPDIVLDSTALSAAYSNIPKDRWISHNVDWEKCALYGEEKNFFGIRFDCKDILSRFPPNQSEKFEMNVHGDTLHTKEMTGLKFSKHAGGAPAKYDWQAIDVKIAECVLRESGLIIPQDSLVKEIEVWYLNEYNERIPRSTVAARLKAYYNSEYLKNSSEN